MDVSPSSTEKGSFPVLNYSYFLLVVLKEFRKVLLKGFQSMVEILPQMKVIKCEKLIYANPVKR